MNDLVKLTARQAVSELKRGAVSPFELIDAALQRIDETGDAVNALPTVCADRARDHAAQLPDLDEADTPRGYLHGLPIAIKDLKDVAGVRSTRGSPIFADHVPDKSDLLVTNLEDKGGIVLAKANTPGIRRRRQHLQRGLRQDAQSLGHEQDLRRLIRRLHDRARVRPDMARLRQRLRRQSQDPGQLLLRRRSAAHPGRVAHGPSGVPFATLSVEGPMGRNVGDVALMLDAQAGAYRDDPLSLPAPNRSFLDWVDNPTPPARVAYSPDLGITPVDSEVAQICRSAIERFQDIGAQVDEASPDFTDAEWIFQTLRGAQFVASYDSLLREHRSELKEEVIWNIEHGLALSPQDIARAELGRGAIINRCAKFFQDYDVLVCPTVVAPPFDVDTRYLAEMEGHTFPTYISWLIATFALTLTGCPTISVPCGFTKSGLPVGIQIMAPWKEEGYLLASPSIRPLRAGGWHQRACAAGSADACEILNLQPTGSEAKIYQVRQVRQFIIKHGLEDVS